ncbi:MurR/RpiR family transcriptional regulator [Fulvimarina endophytica]|uniref:MurR/RpiR family transcriptional regulator n=1 Tax=Fulvimarina endophytica TaxID=2293836 RepID=A0A371X2M1_9HYPH|nr:MurR/RpiR family transcriptional regulator [Fulvimarina endophytica]RFC63477.1 MurR/RpiR family transcriptional regulator [Fulvimarina endophytica]
MSREQFSSSHDADGAVAPESVAELLGRLDRIDEDLPRRLRQCADFLRHNLHLVAVSTVADLASAADVPPSAFMRFCQSLGFTGYSQMQALFRHEFSQWRPEYGERLSHLRAGGDTSAGALLAEFTEAGLKSLIGLPNDVGAEGLEAAARRLAGARTIHLIGLRRSYAVVVYLAYLLGKMGIPVIVHHAAGQIESVQAVAPDDALFAVTFAPFTEETLSFARQASARGVPLVALSDTTTCPLAPMAETMLIAREVEVAGFRAPTAAMALVTSLGVAIGEQRSKAG